MNLRNKEQIEKRIELHTKEVMKLHEKNLVAIEKDEWTPNRKKQENLENQITILRWALGDDGIYGDPLKETKKLKEFDISMVVYHHEDKYTEEEINNMFIDWIESKGMCCGGSIREIESDRMPEIPFTEPVKLSN